MTKYIIVLAWFLGFIPCYPQEELVIFPIQNVHARANGLLKVDLNSLPLPTDFLNHQQVIISIPPMQLGGNHRHPRREILIAFSDDVELHWVDKKGMTHIHKMKEGHELYLFDIPPFVPHAVINLSQTSAAVILELTEEDQHDVEYYPVICPL